MYCEVFVRRMWWHEAGGVTVASHRPTVLRRIYYRGIIVSGWPGPGCVATLNLEFIADKAHSHCSYSSKYLLCATNTALVITAPDSIKGAF